jgi:hypothetical protein
MNVNAEEISEAMQEALKEIHQSMTQQERQEDEFTTSDYCRANLITESRAYKELDRLHGEGKVEKRLYKRVALWRLI